MNLTYNLCKILIEKSSYRNKEDMQIKLDVLYANSRLSTEEYETLVGLLDEQ